MPGVTMKRASARSSVYSEIRTTNARSPALSKCGCVSWSGCPNSRSEAAVKKHLAWAIGALVLCLDEESNGLFGRLLRVINLDALFKIGRLCFILGVYVLEALYLNFLVNLFALAD